MHIQRGRIVIPNIKLLSNVYMADLFAVSSAYTRKWDSAAWQLASADLGR
jgi:hypothetical protein